MSGEQANLGNIASCLKKKKEHELPIFNNRKIDHTLEMGGAIIVYYFGHPELFN